MNDYSGQQRDRKLAAQKQAQTGGSFAAQIKRQEVNNNFARVPHNRIRIKKK